MNKEFKEVKKSFKKTIKWLVKHSRANITEIRKVINIIDEKFIVEQIKLVRETMDKTFVAYDEFKKKVDLHNFTGLSNKDCEIFLKLYEKIIEVGSENKRKLEKILDEKLMLPY